MTAETRRTLVEGEALSQEVTRARRWGFQVRGFMQHTAYGMRRTGWLVLAVSALVSGCAPGGAPGLPTPFPPGYLPTAVYLTARSIDAATDAAAPIPQTPTATATFIPPTLAPSPTATAGLGIPLAAIQIRAPGPMSRIVSPLQVQMLAIAGDTRIIEVDLYGEDGRRLYRSLTPVAGSPEGDPLNIKFPFTIRAAGEDGYLQVSTKDLNGLLRSLVTVRVLLLSAGTSQIAPAGNTIYERVAFSSPPPDFSATGGVVEVEGQVLPSGRQPVIIELITDQGKSLTTRILTVSGADWQAFKTTLPYKVSAPTPARLYLHQADDVLTGQTYVYSQPILLNP